ncbi:RHS repeat-associated core domain-containing protein, partial [Sphingobacterium sp. InxBP1]|uniref:RHS repeat domain-containing protein n=1 Tax=Sphingobacterium sp. InxBP1 TaxID=2870328 RepID=UPI002243B0F8
VLYYDDYGRVIQTASKNHLGGTDYVTNTYNFAGDLLTSTRVHTPVTGAATKIVTTNDYDHVGRLVSTKEKIGSQAEVILTSHSYNEIGQLKTRYMGKAGTEPGYVDTTSYTYNERGWTKRIASSNFTQSQMYQDGGAVRQYNGNIAQVMWRFTPTGATSTFEYGYDKLNRLISGTNGQTGSASIAEAISYDDMGNIKTLKRDAQLVTTYTYDGNKLTGLSGGLTGSYTYDANGNAKTDRLGMVFTYNHLNLPQTAKKSGTDVAFLYDATGRKLQKVSKIGTTTPITTIRDYVDGIEYNNGTIDIIHNPVGYAQLNGTSYVYHYTLTDHLGNVRTTLKRRTGSTTAVDVVQRDNYYPFGKRKVVLGGNNRYLYNGKEIQGELGDQYDYGARFYDAEIGRWNVVDPLADMFEDVSPYNYGMNNPILMIDPTGMAADTISRSVVGPIVDVWRNVSNFRWPTWTYNVPILGAAAESGNNLADGNYVASLGNFGTSLVELFTAGYFSQYRISTKMVTSTTEAASAKLMLGTTRMRLLRNVKNEQLKKMIKFLYRENAKFGNGSTGAMIREEIKNGTVTSGSGSHMVKAKDALENMRKLLNGNYGELVDSDRKIIFEIVEDLTTGTGLKW